MPIREPDLVLPTLHALNGESSGFLSTSSLIDRLRRALNPVGKDAQQVPNRNDDYFSQKVRNLVCHRDSNFVSTGLATYEEIDGEGGLRITAAGKAHLQTQLP